MYKTDKEPDPDNGLISGEPTKINGTNTLFRGPAVNEEAKYFRILIKKNFKVEGLSASAGYNPDIVGIPLAKPGDARCLIDGKNKYARVLIKKKKTNSQWTNTAS